MKLKRKKRWYVFWSIFWVLIIFIVSYPIGRALTIPRDMREPILFVGSSGPNHFAITAANEERKYKPPFWKFSSYNGFQVRSSGRVWHRQCTFQVNVWENRYVEIRARWRIPEPKNIFYEPW